jgi:hypothetical protein
MIGPDDVAEDIDCETRNLMLAVKALDSYRRHPHGKQLLQRLPTRTDLELSRDRLSRVLDDMRGVK